ncbi:MAG: type II secretion system F family protein [Lachnospiraceae bacterium]|nr:type II secretion system F family protein [Lachnospiraceae bacterium]
MQMKRKAWSNMSQFSYEAINKLGKEVKGSVEASTEADVIYKLKQQGLTVVNVKPQSLLTQDINIQIGGYPTARDLSVMCRQFVSMNKAGVTILETLRMLYEQTENKRLKDAIREVRIGIEKGDTLAQALGDHPKIFPELMVNMVAAGEASGTLHVALERVSIQLEKSNKTQSLIKKAMIYPIAVFLVAIVVTVVMLVVVIPSYETMFADLGTELPGITKFYVSLSKMLINYWFIIVPIVSGIIGGIIAFAKTQVGKHVFGKLALKIPIVKNLIIKSASSQMARTLGTLLGSGVTLVEATAIVSDIMSNVYFKEAMKDASDQVSIGMPLSRPLEDCRLFPPMVYHMLRIGEESGNTEEMLDKLADYYDEEVEMAVQALMAAMEPMIIVVLAVVVGGLVGACMAPMLSMYTALDTM